MAGLPFVGTIGSQLINYRWKIYSVVPFGATFLIIRNNKFVFKYLNSEKWSTDITL
jgi:hypothetical protein